MTASVVAIFDPHQAWQEKAFTDLEEVLGCSLDLWTREELTGWALATRLPSDRNGQYGQPTGFSSNDSLPTELLELASEGGIPCTVEITSGRHWLAIPLAEPKKTARSVATALLETDAPELLVQMAKVGQQYFQQHKQLAQLHEENDFFLKQVSNDFEELTLLRSMAEWLCLGDSTHNLSQIVQESMPKLGESVGAESLYFVDGAADLGSRIIVRWDADDHVLDLVDDSVVERLVEEYCPAAEAQPVIKNHLHASAKGTRFSGVRDFVLVSVSTTMGQVGWFLAVNHLGFGHANADYPVWRLSQHEFGTNEASLLCTAAAMIASHANNLSLFQERETLLVNVVRSLVSAVDAKDPYTCGHSERVALYSKQLARQVGYDEQACELLYLTALLHDVGKIAVSDAVLKKTDRLTEEEFEEIKRHPDEGWAILQGLKQLEYVLPGVLHHHERCDGQGYPDRLANNDIPLDGRVLAVADAYDAMTSNRAYRESMSQARAEKILREGAGTQWDASVIDAFFEVLPEIIKIRETYQPHERPTRRTCTIESST